MLEASIKMLEQAKALVLPLLIVIANMMTTLVLVLPTLVIVIATIVVTAWGQL